MSLVECHHPVATARGSALPVVLHRIERYFEMR